MREFTRRVNDAYKASRFTTEHAFHLLSRAVIGSLELRDFIVLDAPSTCEEFKRMLIYYEDSAIRFDAGRSSRHDVRVPSGRDTAPDERTCDETMELIAKKLSELSQMMKRDRLDVEERGVQGNRMQRGFETCTYCGKIDHDDSDYSRKKRESIVCEISNRMGHNRE